jgi:predicted DNA-binding transcriptional regulator AlpA
MACLSREENSRRNPVPRASWTVDEFCSSVGISRSTYERAKREGWGPREMVLGRTGIRIADDAVNEWIAEREEKAATIAADRHGRHKEIEEQTGA